MSVLTPVGKLYCKIFGWRVDNAIDVPAKCVVIAAPHTSNWDLPHTMAVGSALDLPYYFLAKHTLWEGNWGWFFDMMGGLPVDRRKSSNVVEQISAFIDSKDEIALVVAPTGTRAKTDYWKSGFYHIARKADVPIVLGYLDFENKVGGLGGVVYPIGTEKEVMDQVRDFYRPEMGRHPELVSTPRLKGEPGTGEDAEVELQALAETEAAE